MTLSKFHGPFELKAEVIDKNVPKGIAGNFYLGEKCKGKSEFSAFTFGSSYDDINIELKKFIGNYKHFQYSFGFSRYDTFYLACLNYHKLYYTFKNGYESEHPKPPEGRNWFCPICGL